VFEDSAKGKRRKKLGRRSQSHNATGKPSALREEKEERQRRNHKAHTHTRKGKKKKKSNRAGFDPLFSLSFQIAKIKREKKKKK